MASRKQILRSVQQFETERLPFHFSLFTFMHCRRKWQPTPVFLPGESQGWGSLVGCRLWGCTELDMTEVTQQLSSSDVRLAMPGTWYSTVFVEIMMLFVIWLSCKPCEIHSKCNHTLCKELCGNLNKKLRLKSKDSVLNFVDFLQIQELMISINLLRQDLQNCFYFNFCFLWESTKILLNSYHG